MQWRFGFSSIDETCQLGLGVMERVWRGPWWTLPFLLLGSTRQCCSRAGGDKYAVGEATVAVDTLNPNWNAEAAEAAEAAQSYLELTGFSCQGLIDQLPSTYGDRFTVDQASYGAGQVGIASAGPAPVIHDTVPV